MVLFSPFNFQKHPKFPLLRRAILWLSKMRRKDGTLHYFKEVKL